MSWNALPTAALTGKPPTDIRTHGQNAKVRLSLSCHGAGESSSE